MSWFDWLSESERGEAMGKVGVAGSKTTTLECMQELLRDGFSIDHLITLSPDIAQKHEVAGYIDLRAFAQNHHIPIVSPRTYSLKDAADIVSIEELRLDILLVIGWQRLIPEQILQSLPIGAFGMHGSPEPLPRGRGRSPLNWALLKGKTSFLTHLFRYDPGVDSGEIVGMQKFEITIWDDCETLHFKNRIAMNRLLRKHLPAMLAGTASYRKQPEDIKPTYFAKRSAEDGLIRWEDVDAISLYNHIRCQTRPFPGAFSYLNGRSEKFLFWRGHPFDGHLTFPEARPGEVVETFYDGSFLVAVWDGAFRVYDFEAPSGQSITIGDRFGP